MTHMLSMRFAFAVALLIHTAAFAFDFSVLGEIVTVDDNVANEFRPDALLGVSAPGTSIFSATDFVIDGEGMPRAKWEAFFKAIGWETTVKPALLKVSARAQETIAASSPDGDHSLRVQVIRAFASTPAPTNTTATKTASKEAASATSLETNDDVEVVSWSNFIGDPGPGSGAALLESKVPSDLAVEVKDSRPDRAGLGKVSLLWWPKTRQYAFTHVKLAVDGEVWKCGPRFRRYKSLDAVLERARNSPKGRGVYQFELDATPEEVIRLKAFLAANPNLELNSCIGGACRALRETTKIRMRPFLPTAFVGYLTFLKKTRLSGRVTGIQFHGKSQLKNVCGSTHVCCDVFSTTIVCTLVAGILYLIPTTIMRWTGAM